MFLFNTSITLHVLGYSAILRCFEIVVEIAALLYAVIIHVNMLQIQPHSKKHNL
jgi:hypothetical protein